MEITPKHQAIIDAKRCPYCNGTTKLVSEETVYGKSYRGRGIICCSNYPRCDSYVGTHDDGRPLGRLADKFLRRAKKQAHTHFDILWEAKLMTRSEAYEWLSDKLGLPAKYTHIGMFSEETCRKVKELSIKFKDDYYDNK